MTEWTREERYQRIEDVDNEYFKTLKQVDQSKFRQQFHIQPETGLLNDPNGLIFIKGSIMFTSMVPIRRSTWLKVLV